MHHLPLSIKLLSTLLFFIAVTLIAIIAFLPNYDKLPPIVMLSDLLNHAAAFFVLMILLRGSISRVGVWVHLLYLFVFALYIEVVQHFLPNRCADLFDVLADTFGALFALLCIKWIQPKIIARLNRVTL